MLSGEQIKKALGRSIIIHPFHPHALTGTAYTLSVGRFLWLHDPSHNGFPLRPKKGSGVFVIRPGSVVSVLTEEAVYIDSSIGGLVHSRIGIVSQGFSHVSAIVDPTWIGPLLITFQNCSPKNLELRRGEPLAKLTFHRLSKRTSMAYDSNYPGRKDRLAESGFRFYDQDHDFLNRPINCRVDALRRAFLECQASDRCFDDFLREGKHRSVFLSLLVLVLLAAMTSSWWSRAVGVDVNTEANATIIAACMSLFINLFFRR